MSEHGVNELENVIFQRPDIMTDRPTHFCPGCGHGITQRLVGEVLDELNLRERAICVGCPGCLYRYKTLPPGTCPVLYPG